MENFAKKIAAAIGFLGASTAVTEARAQEADPTQSPLVSTEEETRNPVEEPIIIEGPITLSEKQFVDPKVGIPNAFSYRDVSQEHATVLPIQRPREPANPFDGDALEERLNVDMPPIPFTPHNSPPFQFGARMNSHHKPIIGISWSSENRREETERN